MEFCLINKTAARAHEALDEHEIDQPQLILTSTPYPGLAGFNVSVEDYLASWWPNQIYPWVERLSPTKGVLVQIMTHPRVDGWLDTRLFAFPQYLESWGLSVIDAYPVINKNPPPNHGVARRDSDGYELAFVAARSAAYKFNRQRKEYAEKTVAKAATGNMRRADVRGGMAGGHGRLHKSGAALNNYIIVSNSGVKSWWPRAKGGSFHPAVARRFILQYSDPGDTVVDPCCGAGTVPVVAYSYDRRALGIDPDREELDKAVAWKKEVEAYGEKEWIY